MLLVCRTCTTRFAVGLSYCPQCTSTDCYLQGEEDDVAKITKHGGPSDQLAESGQPGYQPVLEVAYPEGEPSQEATGTGRFDPATHTVEEVLLFLDGAGQAEAQRVLDAERAGKARKGILDQAEAILAREDDEGQDEAERW